MRAVVVAGPRRLAVEQVPDPLPARGQAVPKQASLHFVLAYARCDFERTVDPLDRGRLRPAPMGRGRIGLDAVAAASDALERPADPCRVPGLPGS